MSGALQSLGITFNQGWKTKDGKIPKLTELCIVILIENIDSLGDPGDVPDELLGPVLEFASPDILLNIEKSASRPLETSRFWKKHYMFQFDKEEEHEEKDEESNSSDDSDPTQNNSKRKRSGTNSPDTDKCKKSKKWTVPSLSSISLSKYKPQASKKEHRAKSQELQMGITWKDRYLNALKEEEISRKQVSSKARELTMLSEKQKRQRCTKLVDPTRKVKKSRVSYKTTTISTLLNSGSSYSKPLIQPKTKTNVFLSSAFSGQKQRYDHGNSKLPTPKSTNGLSAGQVSLFQQKINRIQPQSETILRSEKSSESPSKNKLYKDSASASNIFKSAMPVESPYKKQHNPDAKPYTSPVRTAASPKSKQNLTDRNPYKSSLKSPESLPIPNQSSLHSLPQKQISNRSVSLPHTKQESCFLATVAPPELLRPHLVSKKPTPIKPTPLIAKRSLTQPIQHSEERKSSPAPSAPLMMKKKSVESSVT